MPSRFKYKDFVEGGIYHLYNRGVEKRNIFLDEADYSTFQRMVNHPLKKGLTPLRLDIIAFCLMPNHYHFLVQQHESRAITKFVRSFSSNYVAYFNQKYERVGPLFQGCYHAKMVDKDAGLLHLSRYIHINPVLGGLVSSPGAWLWSSYPEYSEKSDSNRCFKKVIRELSGDLKKYCEFVEAQISRNEIANSVGDLALE